MNWSFSFQAHSRCFACGSLNSGGLGLIFEKEESRILCRTTIDSRFQSYDGIVHGGVLASIADAAMTNLVYHLFGGRPLTCSLDLRYRSSVHVGDDIAAEAILLRMRHRIA